MVFQDFRLLPNKTVFDNVAFTLQVIGKSKGFIQEAVPDVLKMVGLAGKQGRFPHELSGGEQQRVAIARAVVNKPAILLADEPTGNLDPATSAGIMTLLATINANGTTVLMATHDAGIVDQMKRRVIELVERPDRARRAAGRLPDPGRSRSAGANHVPTIKPPTVPRCPSSTSKTSRSRVPDPLRLPAAALVEPAPDERQNDVRAKSPASTDVERDRKPPVTGGGCADRVDPGTVPVYPPARKRPSPAAPLVRPALANEKEPTMRLGLILGEVGQGLRRNLSMVVSVVLVTFISLTFVGAAILLQFQISQMKGYWYDRAQVAIYLCTDISLRPELHRDAATRSRSTTSRPHSKRDPRSVHQGVEFETQRAGVRRFSSSSRTAGRRAHHARDLQ